MTNNYLPKTRWLVTIMFLLTLGISQLWGAVGGTLKTYNTNSSTFSTGYKRQSGDNFVWWGQKNYYGANNATNHGKLLPTAADLPVVKAHNSSATTSTTGLYYCYTSEAVSNVGAVQITFSAKSGSSTVNAYVVSSSTAASSGSATWTKLTLLTGSPSAQGANVASAGTYTFTFPKETSAKYYGVVFVTSSYWRATGFQMKLLEGCTAPTAVEKGTLTASSFDLTITDAQNAGNYDINFSTSSTAPTASTAAGSFSTVTTKTPTISSGVAASTTYYVWARSAKTVSSVTYKSAWVALTGSTLTTPSASSCSSNPTVGAASIKGSFIWTYFFACFFRHCAQCINHLPSYKKTYIYSFSANLSTTDFQQVTPPLIQTSSPSSHFMPFFALFFVIYLHHFNDHFNLYSSAD